MKYSAAWTILMLGVALYLLGLGSTPLGAGAVPQNLKPDDYKSLPKPGERIPIGPDHYFVYAFSSRAKLGTVVMRVEIFNRDGRRDTSFVVKGEVDMPSMRGAHKTGNKEFSLSAKGVYLLPVSLVMPGDWEFRFTFEKDGKTVMLGAYQFEV
jgi:hypothetical protein